jgi:hypothetical protein
MKKLLVCVLAVTMVGCAAHLTHPNQVNSFDGNSYDSLIVAKSVIDTTRTDLANNAFPASIAGNVKTAVNDLIKAYDVAAAAYATYHTAASTGVVTQAQVDAVVNAIKTVTDKTTALTAAKAAK